MKYVILFLSITIILSCKKNETNTSQFPIEVLFKVKSEDKEDLEYFENGLIPWISIEKAESEVNRLEGKEDIVLKANNAVLLIDYPLNKPTEIEIKSDGTSGFTRKGLCIKISRAYKRSYEEEEVSAQTKTISESERKTLRNRNETDGKYGIWGHDIGDLVMPAAVIRKTDKEKIIIELFIES